VTTRDQISCRLAELDRERSKLEEALRALEAGEIEPAEAMAEAVRAAPARQNRPRLTKSTAAALPIPKGKNAIYWDRDLVGLGLRISPRGTKTYFLQARTRSGRGIKITLGRTDRVTAEQARDAARKHLAAVDLGRDPAQELKDQRGAERERRQAPDVAALWRDFERTHVPGLRPKSRAAYRSWWASHLEPRLGRLKLGDVTRPKVEQIHREVAAGSGGPSANRVLAVLSALLSHAERLGLVQANAARGVKRVPEHGRERVLADVELARLIAHLAASDAPEARVVELLLATGARRGEALAMRWSDVNGGSWWTVPANISKTKKTQRKPLNAAAQEVLARVERDTDLVFAGMTESRLSKWWLLARAELGLDDVRLHDLRHVAASMALNAGAPLSAVSSLLGHGVHSSAMSARYAHIQDEQLARASQAIADRLALLKAEPVGRA
jgi:integrase